jgi:hypothetical protein
VRRRSVLAGVAAGGLGALAALAGCTPHDDTARGRRAARDAVGSGAGRSAQQDPDVAVAAEALDAERRLLELISATLVRHPALDSRLAAARAGHEEHVALLAKASPDPGSATSVPAPSPSGPSSPSTAAGSPSASPAAEVPTSRRRALRAVGAAENELSAQQKQHAFASQSGAFARLLASMAAAAAQQAAVLGGGLTETGSG